MFSPIEILLNPVFFFLPENSFQQLIFKDLLAQLLLRNQCLSFKIPQQPFHIYLLHLFSILVSLSSFLLVKPNLSPVTDLSLILVHLGPTVVSVVCRIAPFSVKRSQQHLQDYFTINIFYILNEVQKGDNTNQNMYVNTALFPVVDN